LGTDEIGVLFDDSHVPAEVADRSYHQDGGLVADPPTCPIGR
jgi:hypothetical protein